MLSTQAFELPTSRINAALKGAPKRTAVAGAETEVALLSARNAQEAGLIEPVLVGDKAAIRTCADTISWDLGEIEIVGADDETQTSLTAVGLARSGDVQLLMKGSVHTEALMRAAVNREHGLRTDRQMSHVFQMTFPGTERALYITDAALNVAPHVEQQLDITRNAVELLKRAGVVIPKVAVLSAVEVRNHSVPSSLDAAHVARLAREGAIEDAVVEGPLSFDIAISADAAAVKGLDSEVAGQADLIVVPNIETGNTLFKALVYFRSATAAGVVVGAKVPIVLTSRADPPEARMAAVALAMMI
jgi:phosphotransacetylase